MLLCRETNALKSTTSSLCLLHPLRLSIRHNAWWIFCCYPWRELAWTSPDIPLTLMTVTLIFLNPSFKRCASSSSIFKESSPQTFLRRWTHGIIKPVVFRMWFRVLAHVHRHLPHTALSHYWKSMKSAISHHWQAIYSDRKKNKLFHQK